MPEVKVKVNNDGTIKFDFSGYDGSECTKDMAILEAKLKELGVNIEDVSIEFKPEYDTDGTERDKAVLA